MFQKFFYYTNGERRGVVALLGVSLALFVAPHVWKWQQSSQPTDFQQFEQDMQAFEAQLQAVEDEEQAAYESKYKKNAYPTYPKWEKRDSSQMSMVAKSAELLAFDPNTATEADFQKMGLPKHTITSLLNYRNKGGKFKTKADVKKIYTLSETDFERIRSYIQLPDTLATAPPLVQNPTATPTPTTPVSKSFQVNINTATAADFEKLRGIGTSFANRIVKYRDALGGFARVEQLAEVYGMPDSTYQAIRAQLVCNVADVKQIALNVVTEQTFKHPYLSPSQCRAILKYRNEQGGSFKSVDFIRTIPALDDEKRTAERIRPYLKLE